jgi:transcriptional regulator with XRE-family HTH domain
VGGVEGNLQRRLGQNLRNLRKAKGLSQEAFADTLRIHRTYMGGLERGERNVTLRTVERIAASLGVDPGELLVDNMEGARSTRRSSAG